ncbi:MAG TPA: RluA family pseudouridine synthase [Anaerolineales bacterium]|nr:RluA family pseudouridine synthase [Anaerolineales bacterium]HMX20179.1 RluA family pseudouridine synthase [Anaerolineales bacterium]HNB87533.1 RluA family pseudouridine synthase [Anaerolineales bacterium]HNE68998.1 RluA family pseudouridine synthase [Anaerolineales bacterium]HNF35889.1 RluA family pseudouridine synthase [Anaerolineales bacterium]
MQIIHKDEDILVINKPADLPVLPDGWDKDAPYLVKMLEADFPKVWVVHRIDKSTSGIIIFALTAEAHRSLNIQFEKHLVEKTYHAILNGSPKWLDKITKFPLRANVGNKHRTVVDNRNGVRAETRFRILKQNQLSALAEAQPMTGRTHQIRVHAYALGYPLLGDILYSAPETDIISRAALHAYSLSFDHPTSNERLTFTAPYPADFEKALQLLKLAS